MVVLNENKTKPIRFRSFFQGQTAKLCFLISIRSKGEEAESILSLLLAHEFCQVSTSRFCSVYGGLLH